AEYCPRMGVVYCRLYAVNDISSIGLFIWESSRARAGEVDVIDSNDWKKTREERFASSLTTKAERNADSAVRSMLKESAAVHGSRRAHERDYMGLPLNGRLI
ncbi:MAG: hypothetical protein ACREOZ_01435, partial [Gloeomargaritales cyanobacterium]